MGMASRFYWMILGQVVLKPSNFLIREQDVSWSKKKKGLHDRPLCDSGGSVQEPVVALALDACYHFVIIDDLSCSLFISSLSE